MVTRRACVQCCAGASPSSRVVYCFYLLTESTYFWQPPLELHPVVAGPFSPIAVSSSGWLVTNVIESPAFM